MSRRGYDIVHERGTSLTRFPQWYPELQVYAPTTPFVLLATKIDLRDDPDTIKHLQAQGTSPITYEQGQALAKDVGAAIYCECSAAKLQGVSEPFTAVL